MLYYFLGCHYLSKQPDTNLVVNQCYFYLTFNIYFVVISNFTFYLLICLFNYYSFIHLNMLAWDSGDLHNICGHTLNMASSPFYVVMHISLQNGHLWFLESEPWNLSELVQVFPRWINALFRKQIPSDWHVCGSIQDEELTKSPYNERQIPLPHSFHFTE